MTYYSGYSATDQFQQVLYATSGLSEGDHQIKISNENARNTQQFPSYVWLDVDFVAFTGTMWVLHPQPSGCLVVWLKRGAV